MSNKTIFINFNTSQLVDENGASMLTVPSISYQAAPNWEVHFTQFDEVSGVMIPVDVTSATSWTAAVDTDFDSGTEPMIRTLPSSIISTGASSGVIIVPLDAGTTNFLNKVDKKNSIPAYFELRGRDSDDRVIYDYRFRINALGAIDPQGGDPIPVEQGGATVADVYAITNGKQNLITNSNKLSYSLISGTPDVQQVGSGLLTLKQDGVTVGTFNANSLSDVVIEFSGGSSASGVTSGWVNGKILEHNESVTAHALLLSSKQNLITSTSKLDYSLISGTPTIPTVNNPTITIKQGTTTKGTFTLNQNQDATITLDAGAGGGGDATQEWVIENFNPIITSSAKLSYTLLSGTPTIPTVNDSTITFTQGGVTKGSFTLNQSSAQTIALDAGGGSTPGSGIITLTQGGVTKGSFNVNQTNDQIINFDAGGSGGDMTYFQQYTSDTVLTALHSWSYFWALQNQDATLYAENFQNLSYDIPIDINLSGSTVTLSGITRNGTFVDGFLNHCLIMKRYTKTYLYVYSYDEGLPMETGWQGEWTTLGQDSQMFSAAAGIYEATSSGHYDIVGGAGYYIELAGTNWRLFNSSGNEIAMGPSMDEPMEGAYGTVESAGVGDSVLTIKAMNIIIPE